MSLALTTPDVACNFLSCSLDDLQQLVDDGYLRLLKIGDQTRLFVEELQILADAFGIVCDMEGE